AIFVSALNFISPMRSVPDELMSEIVLFSSVSEPERIKMLPPLPTSICDLGPGEAPEFGGGTPVMETGPNSDAVSMMLFRGSTGASPGLAMLVMATVPPGADNFAALVIVTGPPTSPRVWPCGTPRLLPLTVIVAGLAFRKPKAAGGA